MADDAKKGSGWWAVVLLLFLLLVLYVLSIGPVVGIMSRTGWGYRTEPPAFYLPLAWLHANTPLGDPLDWYIDLWRPTSTSAPAPVPPPGPPTVSRVPPPAAAPVPGP